MTIARIPLYPVKSKLPLLSSFHLKNNSTISKPYLFCNTFIRFVLELRNGNTENSLVLDTDYISIEFLGGCLDLQSSSPKKPRNINYNS